MDCKQRTGYPLSYPVRIADGCAAGWVQTNRNVEQSSAMLTDHARACWWARLGDFDSVIKS